MTWSRKWLRWPWWRIWLIVLWLWRPPIISSFTTWMRATSRPYLKETYARLVFHNKDSSSTNQQSRVIALLFFIYNWLRKRPSRHRQQPPPPLTHAINGIYPPRRSRRRVVVVVIIIAVNKTTLQLYRQNGKQESDKVRRCSCFHRRCQSLTT